MVGDSCALVRREAFELVGGFTEEYRVGLDDLSFFNRLIHTGHRIEPMPDPVYFYRLGTTSMKSRNRFTENAQVRALEPYLKDLPDEERAFAAFSVARSRAPRGPAYACCDLGNHRGLAMGSTLLRSVDALERCIWSRQGSYKQPPCAKDRATGQQRILDHLSWFEPPLSMNEDEEPGRYRHCHRHLREEFQSPLGAGPSLSSTRLSDSGSGILTSWSTSGGARYSWVSICIPV